MPLTLTERPLQASSMGVDSTKRSNNPQPHSHNHTFNECSSQKSYKETHRHKVTPGCTLVVTGYFIQNHSKHKVEHAKDTRSKLDECSQGPTQPHSNSWQDQGIALPHGITLTLAVTQAQGTWQLAVGGAHTYIHRHTGTAGAHARNTSHSRHTPSLVSHTPTPAASPHLPHLLFLPRPPPQKGA